MAYAFQRALEKRGGTLSLNTHVEELIYDEAQQRCTGVRLRNGKVLRPDFLYEFRFRCN